MRLFYTNAIETPQRGDGIPVPCRRHPRPSEFRVVSSFRPFVEYRFRDEGRAKPHRPCGRVACRLLSAGFRAGRVPFPCADVRAGLEMDPVRSADGARGENFWQRHAGILGMRRGGTAAGLADVRPHHHARRRGGLPCGGNAQAVPERCGRGGRADHGADRFGLPCLRVLAGVPGELVRAVCASVCRHARRVEALARTQARSGN